MNMIPRVLGAVVVLVGGFLTRAADAATTVEDVSQYTIVCDTLTKGQVTFKPSLVMGGSLPTVAKLTGTLSGCNVSGIHGVRIDSGAVSGILTSTTNDCLNLFGVPAVTGTIIIKWKAASGFSISPASTIITISTGNVYGGTATPFFGGATYGTFGFISGTAVNGAFLGTDNGASSFADSITVQGFGTLTPACSSLKGLKTINFGSSHLNLG
jgi:hypothetical protein